MVQSTDPFWNDIEVMNNGGKKCKFCGHLFSRKTSISRIKWHLSGVKRQGVKICEKVPKEVQDAARAAIDGPPEKRNKYEAGSSNNEVTNAISAPAKEQNNEVIHLDMAQQEEAFPPGEFEPTDLLLPGGSSNNGVTDAISAPAKEQNTEVAQQEAALSPGEIASLIDELLCSPPVNNDVTIQFLLALQS